MPVITQPNLIEVSDFSKGAAPDLAPTEVGPDRLISSSNLLPDSGTGTLQLRRGYKRIHASPIASGYTVQTLRPYSFFNSSDVRKNYLIAVMRKDGTSDNTSDNVRVYAYDMDAGTWAWISNGGVAQTWLSADARHWGETIDNVYYGGSALDPMYKWDGTTFTADCSAHDFKSLVADTSGINLSTEVSKNRKFKAGAQVIWTDSDNASASYRARKAVLRGSKKWDSGHNYGRGDKVHIARAWYVGKTWVRAFRCKKDHDADATNRPGDGSGSWQTYWRPVRHDDPRNESSELSDDWFPIPEAATTDVAAWGATQHRLFLRYDDITAGRTRVQFSAAAEKDEDSVITALQWNPKNFAPGDTTETTGGGWLPDLGGTEPVTAFYSFGVYFFIFTRNSTWVINGGAERTWNFHKIADVGCVNKRAVVALDGLVYFIGPQGLSVSDGTIVGEVEGAADWTDYIKTRCDSTTAQTYPNVTLWAYDHKVWMGMPSAVGGNPAETLVYDLRTKSIWKTTLAPMDVAVFRRGGQDYFYFVPYGENIVMQYDHSDVQSTPTDDDAADSGSQGTISWSFQSGWFSFGTLKEQRRIRRIWGLIRNVAATATMSFYRNYSTSVESSTSTKSSSATAGHIEGKWLADCHALSIALSGTGHVEITGLAVDSQPRRMRYAV